MIYKWTVLATFFTFLATPFPADLAAAFDASNDVPTDLVDATVGLAVGTTVTGFNVSTAALLLLFPLILRTSVDLWEEEEGVRADVCKRTSYHVLFSGTHCSDATANGRLFLRGNLKET